MAAALFGTAVGSAGTAWADDTGDQITQEQAGTGEDGGGRVQVDAVDNNFTSFFNIGDDGEYLLEFTDNVAVADGTSANDLVLWDRCDTGDSDTFSEVIDAFVALGGGTFVQAVDDGSPTLAGAETNPVDRCPVFIDLDGLGAGGDAAVALPQIVDMVRIINIDDPSSGAPGFDIVEIQALNSATPATMDIKFISDPNGYNCKKKGVLPLTIFGTSSVDVTDIDIDSLELCLLSDLSSCVSPPRSAKPPHDRGNPEWAGVSGDNPDVVTFFENDTNGDPVEVVANIVGNTTDTTPADGIPDQDDRDGLLDLDVGFDSRAVATLIGCSGLSKNDLSAVLVVKGNFESNGSFISIPTGDPGADQLTIKNKP